MKDFCVFCMHYDFKIGYDTGNPRERGFIICVDHYNMLNKFLNDDFKELKL